MNCSYCKTPCIKKGFHRNGSQKLFCKQCRKHQLLNYVNKACEKDINRMLVKLLCNGCGIRDISRVLEISATTVIDRIKILSRQIIIPSTFFKGRKYEVDELKTYVKKKKNEFWVCCTLEKESKTIMSLSVGRRNNGTLKRALIPVLLSKPERIHSDRLKQYRSLINMKIHNVKQYTINNVERQFLNFRTHIKRLCRRTICFSKKAFMLEAVLKIYIWNRTLIFQ